MHCDMNSAPGKSPSVWRAAVIAGALSVSAMTPANAAAMPGKPIVTKKKLPDVARPAQQSAARGGNPGPLSLQWVMGASLRP